MADTYFVTNLHHRDKVLYSNELGALEEQHTEK